MSSRLANVAFPAAKADLCVKCGLCLPHCPTYRETQHEAESPRGRITLMQGLASGLVPASPTLQAHLDACLGCRACERVCPAQVPYGELIDAGRAMSAAANGVPGLTRRLAPWLQHRALRALARLLLRCWQYSGLQGVLRRSGLLRGRARRLESLLPAAQTLATPGITPQAPRAAMQNLRVSLFRGCVNDIADRDTLHAIRTLFEHCGIGVDEPSMQTCCGALQQHAGDADGAARLARTNADAFADSATPIVYAASGCGATLKEYARVGSDVNCTSLASRVREPHQLLLEHWPQDLSLRPLAAKIAVHLPCTQLNVTGGGDTISALLKKIPQAEVFALDRTQQCCGAAGTYFVSEAEMADRLLAHKLDALVALRPDYLVSSNIGCTLHLAAGLARRGLTVPVLHPLALLAQQWCDT